MSYTYKEINQLRKDFFSFLLSQEGKTSVDNIEHFLDQIDCGKITAKSTDKADIRIVIHNLMNGTKPELGYSIKSKLGRDSTLINAGGDNTNFIFKISGISRNDIISINNEVPFKE